VTLIVSSGSKRIDELSTQLIVRQEIVKAHLHAEAAMMRQASPAAEEQ
jgi:hypothetical protein